MAEITGLDLTIQEMAARIRLPGMKRADPVSDPGHVLMGKRLRLQENMKAEAFFRSIRCRSFSRPSPVWSAGRPARTRRAGRA